MDRPTVFPGATPRSIDFLRLGQSSMVALAKLVEAVIGTGPVVDGFALAPTAPASLSVILAGGSIYQQATLEATQWSALPTDNHTVVKQGIALDPVTFTVAPPSTTGYAQNFLVEAQFVESDTAPVVLTYYNAANPAVPFQGPANAGTADLTIRKGGIAVQVKAGTAAPAGTQVTPSPDAGWAGLWVITVAAGATTVTAGNIAIYPAAPFLVAKLGQLPGYIQNDAAVFCTDVGTVANKIVVTPVPALTAYVPGQRLKVKLTRAITGATTINVSGLGERPLVRQGGAACVGGEAAVGDHLHMSVRDSDVQIIRLTASDVGAVAHIGDDVSSTPNLLTVDVSPSITTYAPDHLYSIGSAHDCPGGTVNANLDGVGNRLIRRSDGSALAANDWKAGDRLLLDDDGTNLRLIGLTKVQVQELAGSSTTVNNAIYNLSPGGLASVTASAGLQQQSDIAPVPNYTTVLGTGSFQGASFVTNQGACALRAVTSSGGAGTVRFGLFDEAQGIIVATSPYVGGGSPTQGNQSPYTVPGFVFKNLDRSKRYHVVILAQKGNGDPQTSTWDPSIFAQHDGSNV